jgi:hypothetical protein
MCRIILLGGMLAMLSAIGATTLAFKTAPSGSRQASRSGNGDIEEASAKFTERNGAALSRAPAIYLSQREGSTQ